MIKTTIKINGMACGMCEAHINDTIRKVCPQAKKVKSSHTKGEASFLTETAVKEEDLRKAIDETGYSFISCESEPYMPRRPFWKK